MIDLKTLLGPNVNTKFTQSAMDHAQGMKDYPSFDPSYYYNESYQQGYAQAYHDDMDAREEREAERREFPRSAQIDRRNGL